MNDSTPTTLVVRSLGDFSVTVAGTPVESWRAGKARNLFQFLLFNRGHVVPRDRLCQVLWPDSDGDRSTSLKVAAHALRRILGTDEVSISYQDVGYLLRCDGVWVDIEQFEATIEAARAAERDGDPGRALAAHHRATTLYQGDFLDGETASWADGQRQWARSMVLGSLNHLRADAMRRSDPGAVITWCRRILSIDPFLEEAYQNLFVVHGMLGELSQVRNWYDLCAQRLRDELDIAPSHRTRKILELALSGRLLGQEPAANSRPEPAPASLQPFSLAT